MHDTDSVRPLALLGKSLTCIVDTACDQRIVRQKGGSGWTLTFAADFVPLILLGVITFL